MSKETTKYDSIKHQFKLLAYTVGFVTGLHLADKVIDKVSERENKDENKEIKKPAAQAYNDKTTVHYPIPE